MVWVHLYVRINDQYSVVESEKDISEKLSERGIREHPNVGHEFKSKGRNLMAQA
jgi:hypothetical protein